MHNARVSTLDVNDRILGMAAGLELERPVADAGRYDEIGVQSPFVSVIQAVFADPLTHVVDGNELAAARVAAEHKVGPGLRLGVEVVGLVIQHDDVLLGVEH